MCGFDYEKKECVSVFNKRKGFNFKASCVSALKRLRIYAKYPGKSIQHNNIIIIIIKRSSNEKTDKKKTEEIKGFVYI